MSSYLRSHIQIDKPIVYIDMDGVLVDFDKRVGELASLGIKQHKLFQHPEAYKNLEPIEGAQEAFKALQEKYEVYILSTPPWSNPDAWGEKRKSVEVLFGIDAKKKLILSHNKGLLKGDYIIDDRDANGVLDFTGEHIHFGSGEFPDWTAVLNYLIIENGKRQ